MWYFWQIVKKEIFSINMYSKLANFHSLRICIFQFVIYWGPRAECHASCCTSICFDALQPINVQFCNLKVLVILYFNSVKSLPQKIFCLNIFRRQSCLLTLLSVLIALAGLQSESAPFYHTMCDILVISSNHLFRCTWESKEQRPPPVLRVGFLLICNRAMLILIHIVSM